MHRVLVLLCFVSCLGSCSEDPPTPAEPTLPHITQTGENTFGCYVNGELWLPKGGWMDPKLIGGYLDSGIDIRAVQHSEDALSSLRLYFNGVTTDTVFAIHNYFDSASYQHFKFFYAPYSENLIYEYYPLAINSGELTLLKLDTVNQIMSGTFHFIAVDTFLNDTVRIEDGRFDIHYPLF